MRLFDHETMDLAVSYLLSATGRSYENFTWKETIFLNL